MSIPGHVFGRLPSTTFHSHLRLILCPGPPFKHSLYPTDSSQLLRRQIPYLLRAPRSRFPSSIKYTHIHLHLPRRFYPLVLYTATHPTSNNHITPIHGPGQEIRRTAILYGHSLLDRNALCHGIRSKRQISSTQKDHVFRFQHILCRRSAARQPITTYRHEP